MLELKSVKVFHLLITTRQAETRRPWQQQQEDANAAAEAAALQTMHEETTRLAGEHKGGRVTSNFYLEGTFHFPAFVRLQVYLKRCAVWSLAIMSVSTLSLLPVVLCVRLVAVRDAETRRAWQQQ